MNPYLAELLGTMLLVLFGDGVNIAARLQAWRQVLSAAGIAPLSVDLAREVDAELAQRIESGLLPDGEMRG